LLHSLAGLGSCGIYSGGNELVCAMAAPDFDPQTPNGNPNNNNLCGKQISVSGPKGTVTVRVVDRCPVCKSVSETI
jgi:expansin (peptidoglycan-binding protein)